MILDTVENIELYKGLHQRLSLGLEYIANTDFSKLEEGTYEIDGEHLFAILQSYNSKEESICRLEAHKKYIDIQYLIEGEEFIGVEPLANQEVLEDLLEENDVIFYKGKAAKIKLSKGSFMVFFPTDVHAPGIQIEKPTKVIKVVVKVAV